jgi:hypothetical protein
MRVFSVLLFLSFGVLRAVLLSCRGDAPAGAPKGMKTNEVCDRPLETFGALPCLLIGIGGFLFLGVCFSIRTEGSLDKHAEEV